ncbi:MAG: hypothetical protein Q4A30_01890, partial [Candidatus Saccharibacteria bacterium]|nr:hypothetical protein [Candidatus Saccharibacteria bacterium]
MKTGRNSLKIKFGIKMGAVLIFVLGGVSGVLIKNNAFANNSDGAGGVGGGSGNPSNKPCDEHTPGDCSDCGFENEQQARRCPHYIITSIEDFRDRAWVRQIAGPYTQEAFDICTDPVRNPSGKVVWVGMEGIYDGVPDYVLKNLVTGLVKYKKISTFSNVLTDPKETPNDKKHEIYKLKPNYGTAEIRRSKELRNRYGTEPLENDANYFWDKVVPGYQFAPGTETLPENQRVPMTWFVAMQIVMDQLNLGDDTTLAFFCPGLIGPPPPPPGDTPPPPPNPDF